MFSTSPTASLYGSTYTDPVMKFCWTGSAILAERLESLKISAGSVAKTDLELERPSALSNCEAAIASSRSVVQPGEKVPL